MLDKGRDCSLLTFAAIAWSVILSGDPAPEFIEFRPKDGISKEDRDIVDAIQKRRRAQYERALSEIEAIDEELPRLRKALVRPAMKPRKKEGIIDAKGNRMFASKEDKAAAIRHKEGRRARMETTARICAGNPAGEVMKFRENPSIGQIGQFDGGIRVTQVISKSEVIADTSFGTAWLECIDAAKLVDGDALRPKWPVYVSGTKSYTNALGQKRTVLLLRPFEIQDYVTRAQMEE